MRALLLASSLFFGGVSLLAFYAVLFAGPFELVPLGLDPETALLWDATLCGAFFVQHSVMVRPWVRSVLGRAVPSSHLAALYSIASGVVLLALVLFWQVTDVSLVVVAGGGRVALRAVFVASTLFFGWAIKSLGSFDAFGTRALRSAEEEKGPFVVRGPYRWVRHPLYALFLVMLWSSPDVTADRLLLSLLFSGWLVLGALLEERDLVRRFGDEYRRYQAAVPMLIPWRPPGAASSGGVR